MGDEMCECQHKRQLPNANDRQLREGGADSQRLSMGGLLVDVSDNNYTSTDWMISQADWRWVILLLLLFRPDDEDCIRVGLSMDGG